MSESANGNKKAIRLFYRILFWCLGQFFLAMGIVFSVKADLGVGAGTLIPVALVGKFGISLGTAMIIFFGMLVLVQIILLRKEFKWFNLVQIFGSIVFGIFTDAAGALLAPFEATTYPVKLLFVLLCVLFQAVGIAIYIDTNLILMAAEGTTDAIHRKLLPNKDFGTARVAFDLSLFVIGALVSLVLLGKVTGIREGTIIIAVGVGKVMSILYAKIFEKPCKRLFYGEEAVK